MATARDQELVAEVLASEQWGGFHDFVGRFESAFASFQQCRHGISAANGTLTLEMMLEAAGIGPGDEVIVPAISFISTATAVSRVGAAPVFVDIEDDTFNLDPARAEAAISPRTRAILAVHFGGPMADMDRLSAVAERHNLALFEDAAHAHGSEWKGRRAGSIGWAGSFSFQNSKVMTSGEGGIVVTNDDRLAAECRSVGNQGRRPGSNFFCHHRLATNMRLTGLQAALLTAGLERLPEQIALRTERDLLLRRLLAGVPGLRVQRVPAGSEVHSRYLFLLRVDAAAHGRSRDDLCSDLQKAGVPCTPFYPHALYGNPIYRHLPCRIEPCPVAEACIRDALWLPHRVLMADEETIHEVAALLRAPAAASAHTDPTIRPTAPLPRAAR